MMKTKGLFSTAIKSFRLGARLAPRAFWGYVIFSMLGGLLSLATIGSFSLLVNKVSEMIATGGSIYMPLSVIITEFLPYIGLLLASYFIPSAVGDFRQYFEAVFNEKSMTGLSKLFAQKQSTLDAATIESSEYQNKIQQGNEWGRGAIISLVMRITTALSSLVSIVVALVVLVSIDIRLAGIAVISALPLYYVEQRFNRELFRIRRLRTDSKRIIGDRLGLFQSQYSLIELNMFNSSSKFVAEVGEHMDREDEKIVALQGRKKLVQVLYRFYSALLSIASGLLVVQRGLSGRLPIGSMVFAYSAYSNFYGSVFQFFGHLALAQDSTRYALIWFDVFETRPIITSKEGALVPSYEHPPIIEFVNVSFRYIGSEYDALTNINLTIRPGEKLAIVGLSGAGKTTLIKLLSRVYDPTEGYILVGGVDLRDIDLVSWHDVLAVMFQTYGKYNVTVEESVALGRNGRTIHYDNVETAILKAGAQPFVSKLKDGIKQLIWKGFKNGTELSGGEHQRLAIARIFYRDALISVLDEPTSSVDALTAQLIFKNLEDQTLEKTVILISHNFSTVQDASNIVVLENGTIIEQGTHESLHSARGRYSELYDMQAGAFNK